MSSGSEFKITKSLGSGSFGQVFLANKKGKCFAVKKISTSERNTARQEIRILKEVEHKHILKYHGHYKEENTICMVLEYANKGTMEKVVMDQEQEEWDAWRFVSHIASALDYLHSKNPEILHFNLRPDKILGVTEPSRNSKEPGHRTYWKLAGFGVAKRLTREVQDAYHVGTVPGAPVYIGPEVLNDFESYSAASDIWSLGCVTAFYMRGGRHVFNCKDDVLRFQPDSSGNVIFDKEETNFYSTSLVKMVLSMLQERHIDIFWTLNC